MNILFWLSLSMIFYTYFGYIALLVFLNLFRREVPLSNEDLPYVSIIIAAYNEERVIEQKVRQTLALDYPVDRMEVIVASDASSDATDSLVKNYRDSRVKLVRQSERRGKTAAQNMAVGSAQGEILVFSDATTVFDRKALIYLIERFEDSRVGAVGGEEVFVSSSGTIAKEAGFFWRYEKLIRRLESRFNTMIGVSGCIFAIRRELYGRLDPRLIEDFALPLRLAQDGYRTVCEPRALAYEEAAADTGAELSRKARIVCGGIGVVVAMRHLLNPRRYPQLSFQLISHKLLRWLAPVFMALLFIANVFLCRHNLFYLLTFILQAVFYALAALGARRRACGKGLSKPLRLIYHFCVVNTAAFWGVVKFIKGERQAVWETVR